MQTNCSLIVLSAAG